MGLETSVGALPYPLAQTLRRAVNAKSPEGHHLAAYYFFESTLKLCAAAQVAAYVAIGCPTARVNDLLGQLARPSAGQWLSFLREVSRSLADRAEAGVAPLRGVHERLTRRLDRPAARAFLQAAARVDGREDDRRALSALDVFEAVVAYRNREIAHGAQRPAAHCAEVGTLIVQATLEALLASDPLGGLAFAVSRDVSDPRTGVAARRHEALRGDGIRDPLGDEAPDEVRALPAGRLLLVGGGAWIPLHPLLAYEVDDLDRDRIGFLNPGTRGKAEFIDYDSGARLESQDARGALALLLARLRGAPSGAAPGEPAGDDPADRPRPPDPGWIGDFELLGELGRGGMGIVYKARQASLGRMVALKVLPPALARDPVSLARFRREVAALGRCDHPNVVKVLHAGLSGTTPYYAMEYVEGGDLSGVYRVLEAWSASSRGRLREGHLREAIPSSSACAPSPEGAAKEELPRLERVIPPAPRIETGRDYHVRVAEVMADAARGVHHLHERGVIHRDLKPGNIMLAADGARAVVMDLGLALLADRSADLTAAGASILGTLRYMPPEQLQRNLLEVTHLADVYALGATLYELACLAPIHDAEDERLLIRQVLQEEPVPPRLRNPAVPADLATVISVATAKLAAERYPSALALAEDLERFARGEPILVRPPTALRQLLLFYRRNCTFVRTALAAALALVVLTAAFIVRLQSERAEAVRQKEIAEEAKAEAVGQREIALEARAEYERLADLSRLRKLEEQARWLFPVAGEKAPEMRSWLERARALSGRLEPHRAALAALRARARRTEVTSGDRDPVVGEYYDLPTAEEQFRHDNLAPLVLDLEGFARREGGLMAEVARRLAIADDVRIRSLDGVAHVAWERTIAAIAASPRYGGLMIAPQEGLLPLGPDPASGLFEFAHLATGAPPERDAAGRLVLAEESGIVFVLLPGGPCTMGAVPPGDGAPEGGPHVDARAEADEAPLVHVSLAPYFISKFEMTRGQWRRLSGEDPSTLRPDRDAATDAERATPLRPVAGVSRDQCDDLLDDRFGLALPSEAQWEHAARAGTTTPWWTGGDERSLAGAANLDDLRARAASGLAGAPAAPWLDDGFSGLAPVGSLRANAFGLHDTAGNVWEWCRDGYASYASDVARMPGTGAQSAVMEAHIPARGGSFRSGAREARSAMRFSGSNEFSSVEHGVRPARAVGK